MSYVIIMLLLIIVAFALYFVVSRKRNAPITLTSNTSLANSVQVGQFLDAERRRLKNINKWLIIILILFVVVPVGVLYVVQLDKGTDYTEMLLHSMQESITIFGLYYVVLLSIAFLFRFVLFGMVTDFHRAVEQLNQHDFDQLLEEHIMLNYFDKMIHPMVLNNDVLFVFKMGRVVEIKTPNITKIKTERQLRGGGLIVKIWEDKKYSLFLVTNRRYCEAVLSRVQVFLRNGVGINA